MVSTLFRDPQARNSALAALGTLQPRAFRSQNCVETLDSVSNYYLDLEGQNGLIQTNSLIIISFIYLHRHSKVNICVGMRLLCSIFSQLFYSALFENSSNYSHLCTLLVSLYAQNKN